MHGVHTTLRIAVFSATALGLGSTQAQAQGLFVTNGTIVVADGDQAPGQPTGTLFGGSAVDFASLDDAGNVFFRGRMQGGTLLPTTDRALFYGSNRSNLQLVIQSGALVPTLTNGETLNTATGTGPGSNARLSGNGTMFWTSAMTGGSLTTSNDSAVFTGTIGNFVIAAREGDAAPGTVGATLSSSLASLSTQPTGLNDSGRILFQSATTGGDTTTANNAAWFGGTPGNLELMFRKGTTLGTGEVVSALGSLSIQNSAGKFLHDETLSTVLGTPPATTANDRTLWLYTPGGTPGSGTNTLIGREGDSAPDTTGATFGAVSAFSSPWNANVMSLRDDGTVMMWIYLTGGDVVGTSNEYGLYQYTQANGWKMMLRKGDVAPGTGGEIFSGPNFSGTTGNNLGQVAFQASLVQSANITTANDTGIWIASGTVPNTTVQKIIQEGDPAPGTVGATIGNLTGLGNFFMNDLGQLTFQVDTVGGDTVAGVNDQVYYAWDPTLGLTLLFRRGTALEITPGNFRTITSWGNLQFSNGAGRGLSLNNNGRLAMKFNWNSPNNASAIMVVDIPHATPSTAFCTGDVVGVDCLACGNNGAAGRGCANSSFASGGLLASGGIASVGADTMTLTASDIPGPGLFFQSTGTGSVNPFGDGMLCATVGIIRMGVVFPDAFGVATYPGGLTPAPIGSFGATAGTQLHYQCWYRDAAVFCGSATFNTTNGVSLTWTP